MKIDSILFDLDGTLWDSVDAVAASWNLVLEPQAGISITRDELSGLMGLQMPQIAAAILPELSEDEQLRILDECSQSELAYLAEHGGILYDNLEETLTELAEKYRLFIVSNCQSGYIECFLKAHRLEALFDGFECWGNTNLSKGENIKRVIEQYNLSSTVMVGDTVSDCNAAEYAGVPFVFARYGFGEVETDRCAAIIDSFGALVPLFCSSELLWSVVGKVRRDLSIVSDSYLLDDAGIYHLITTAHDGEETGKPTACCEGALWHKVRSVTLIADEKCLEIEYCANMKMVVFLGEQNADDVLDFIRNARAKAPLKAAEDTLSAAWLSVRDKAVIPDSDDVRQTIRSFCTLAKLMASSATIPAEIYALTAITLRACPSCGRLTDDSYCSACGAKIE